MKKPLDNYAFIDAQNVHKGVKSQGWLIDYKKFKIYLTEKYGAKQIFLFIGFLSENVSLYKKLQTAGFICIFKPVLMIKNGEIIKGNVDAEMILHTMIEYQNYKKAIIVTGDGDFSCLVEYLKENDKLECVLSPDRNKCSSLLKRFAKEKMIFMNDLKNKIGK